MWYEFGPFQLDPETLVLRCHGEPVPITNKALQTLRVLVENAGRVVGKDELLTTVWSGLSVEEANLTQNIYALRRTLGEKPQDHRFIVTVPGQGYRFVAEVKACHSPVRNDVTSLNGYPSGPTSATRETVFRPDANEEIAGSAPPAAPVLTRRGVYYLSRAALAILALGIAAYFALKKTAEP